MNCECWSSGATKLGWVVQIEQLAVAARWVSGLGVRQLMMAWVLGSKMGLSRVCVGSGVMAWVAASRRDGSPTFSVSLSPLPFFFFFPLFLSFPFGFGVLLIAGFSSSSSSFIYYYYYYYYFFLHIYIFLRFSLALEISWAGRLG